MRTRRILKAVLIALLAASLPLAMSGESRAQSMFSRGKGVGVKPPPASPGRPGMSGGGGRGPNWGGVGAGIAAGVVGAMIMQGIANANTAPPDYYDDPPQRALPRRAPNRAPIVNRVSGVPAAGENRYVPDEIVATVPATVAPRTLAAIEQRHRLSRVETHRSALASATLLRWRIADGRGVLAAIRALEREGAVSGVQPNYVYTLQQDGTAAASVPVPQYALDKLHLPQAHERARGDGVRVAVIDSGIDVSHPALQGAVVAQFNAAASPADVHNHGTGIAGLIAARGSFTGSAPAAQILAVRAFDPASASANPSAQAATFAILKGLDWSVVQQARVINMSFAGPADPAMTRALLAASRKGAILVAAAGNAGAQSPPLYPAADPNVIAVTATGAEDAVFPRANQGRYVAVAAPGVDVVAPATAGGYQVSSGTSLSAAEISGVIALLLQRRPGLKAAAVRTILTATARDLGNPGRDDVFGAGLVDAYQAVMSLEPKSVQAENPVR